VNTLETKLITEKYSTFQASWPDKGLALKREGVQYLLFLKKKTGGLKGYGKNKLWNRVRLEYEPEIVTDLETNQEVSERMIYWLEVNENLFQLINEAQKEYNEMLYDYT
jgi:hypothetical protein